MPLCLYEICLTLQCSAITQLVHVVCVTAHLQSVSAVCFSPGFCLIVTGRQVMFAVSWLISIIRFTSLHLNQILQVLS